MFAGHLILRKHDPFDLPFAQFDIYVFHVDFPHDTIQQFEFFVGELTERIIALGFVQFLQDDLFRRLGGDPAEILRHELLFHTVADLIAFFDALRLFDGDLRFAVDDFFYRRAHDIILDAALFRIDPDIHIPGSVVVLLFIGRNQSRTQRLDKDLLRDPLLRFQICQRLEKFLAYHTFVLRKNNINILCRSIEFDRLRDLHDLRKV